MTKISFLLLLALILVLTSSPVSLSKAGSPPQQPSHKAEEAWLRIQSTASGVELILEPNNGDSFRGRFISASHDTLSLSIKGKTFDVARSLIRRLYSVKERSRSKLTLVGAGIGLVVGIGCGLLVVAGSDSVDANFAPVSFGFVGMLAGGAIGALTGGKRKGQLLYESK
jgi:hypothetical protein